MPKIGRADFHPEYFESLVEQKGYRLTHYRAMPCFCLSPDTGQPDPNCSYCTNGWQYWGEEEIKGVVTGFTTEKQFAEGGQFLLGSMRLTINHDVVVGYHDRIVHQDSVMPFAESLVCSGTTDRLRFVPTGIERIIGANNAAYAATTDYTLSGRTITWVSSGMPAVKHGPAVGARFSVSYLTHPTWLVLSHLHLIRDTMVKAGVAADTYERLPVQVLCKLEFLVDG